VRLLASLLAAFVFAPVASAADWSGTFRLPASAEAVRISVAVTGSRAVVALGPGHSGRTTVTARLKKGRLHFALPGLPKNVVFDGRIKGTGATGSVAQGALHGTFKLTRGRDARLSAYGLYRSSDGAAIAIVEPGSGFPTWLVELPSGDIHGVGASLTTVGARAGDRSGDGTLAVAAGAISWTHAGETTRYERVRVRQREVRVGQTAATLTLPPGRGPFPGVAMVHGSDPNGREEFQVFAAYCTLLGIAVVADDKRGIGQSGGRFLGESPIPATVDALARDAQAEVRFLGTLAQVDPTRVGLLGDSQAGWIIALAAARERAVRWAVPLAGPTVSVDETNNWGTLAGKGVAPPAGTTAEMNAQVRAEGRGGFDPEPSLRKLTIPVHWIFADDDRNVPTQLCIERLQQLQTGHEFSWSVVHATHTLLELPSGLNSDIARSRGFAATLFPEVGRFLRSRQIVRAA
jgi:pimeloyl-ACP methyl ester carboxylesterase